MQKIIIPYAMMNFTFLYSSGVLLPLIIIVLLLAYSVMVMLSPLVRLESTEKLSEGPFSSSVKTIVAIDILLSMSDNARSSAIRSGGPSSV